MLPSQRLFGGDRQRRNRLPATRRAVGGVRQRRGQFAQRRETNRVNRHTRLQRRGLGGRPAHTPRALLQAEHAAGPEQRHRAPNMGAVAEIGMRREDQQAADGLDRRREGMRRRRLFHSHRGHAGEQHVRPGELPLVIVRRAHIAANRYRGVDQAGVIDARRNHRHGANQTVVQRQLQVGLVLILRDRPYHPLQFHPLSVVGAGLQPGEVHPGRLRRQVGFRDHARRGIAHAWGKIARLAHPRHFDQLARRQGSRGGCRQHHEDAARCVAEEERRAPGIGACPLAHHVAVVVGDHAPHADRVSAPRFFNGQLVGGAGRRQGGQAGGLAVRHQQQAREKERQPAP